MKLITTTLFNIANVELEQLCGVTCILNHFFELILLIIAIKAKKKDIGFWEVK